MLKFRISLATVGLVFAVACSGPANTSSTKAPAPPPDIKLASSASYPSGTTQSVIVNVAKLDESKGVNTSATGGCSTFGPAEKTGPGTYKVSVTITGQPQDGVCTLSVISAADSGTGTVSIPYLAIPDYWKKQAPGMYNFANSKVWTFHSGEEVKVFKLLEVSPSTGNKLAVLLVGDGDTRAGMSVSQDNDVVGEYKGCVVEGKFNGSMAVLRPMMQGDTCNDVKTVTLMVSK